MNKYAFSMYKYEKQWVSGARLVKANDCITPFSFSFGHAILKRTKNFIEKGDGFMSVLRDPLFLTVDFLNVHKKDKGSPTLSVRINLQRDDLIYVASNKNRTEVIGFVHPDTGLFITDVEGEENGNVYHRFRLLAVSFAKEKLKEFLAGLQAMDAETYEQRGYHELSYLTHVLTNQLIDRQTFYGDLQKQVNLLVSKKFPKVNEYLAFSDTDELSYPVTAKLPYANPQGRTLEDEEFKVIDSFLDVFFDSYNKFVFSWFLGAVLSNLPLYDDRISKLGVLSSSFGGSGKSTLVNALTTALFTNHYRDIKDDFDSFFPLGNRFGTSVLSTKRMSVYSEANWNTDAASEDHDFSGLNISAIKSLVTEGYLSKEFKYGDRLMDRLSGFHLVLTNYPPVVSQADSAMKRRILPMMIKPSSMAEKARELNLWGSHKFAAFVKEHAESFAVYFSSVFREHEYAFSDFQYNPEEYKQDMNDMAMDKQAQNQKKRAELEAKKAEGVLSFLEGLIPVIGQGAFHQLKTDIDAAFGGTASESLQDGIRVELETNKLYLDSSKNFLLRYGAGYLNLRDELKSYYGAPVRKFHKRMFEIQLPQS